ncbi:MAG: hypothetical protein ACLTX6_04135 [Lachnospiraceae bacterium]
MLRTRELLAANTGRSASCLHFIWEYTVPWAIYLNKHIVHKSMRQHLTAIGCMMVFWFFLRTVKYHIFKTPLGGHICWYLYYVPMILIPTLGLTATLLLEERDEKRIKRISAALLLPAVVLIVCVLTNDLHQQVFCFLMEPPYSDENYHYGKIFFVSSCGLSFVWPQWK